MFPCLQKRTILAQLAAVAKAMANEHRLRLLLLLACGEHSVKTLSERSGLSAAKTSRHLQLLRRAGLVSVQRHDDTAFYQVADNRVLSVLDAVYKAANRDPGGIERFLHSYVRTHAKRVHISRGDFVG